jgi:recombination protein U
MTVWRTRGHRGDALEEIILLTNEFYRNHHFAIVDKASTPIKVVDIDDKGLITKGYFEKKSTVDFIGLVQGIAIAFDAKETRLKSLPLSNIHQHQIDYMCEFNHQGGLAFIIVHFTLYNRYFLLPYEIVESYQNSAQTNGRKSIPFSEMSNAFEITREHNGILNYLPALNEYIAKKKSS